MTYVGFKPELALRCDFCKAGEGARAFAKKPAASFKGR
jgi:hypothetical protein